MNTINEPITERLRSTLDDFHRSGLMSIIGAENSWRGFELQALYICGRVANHNENASYLPETVEDLLVVFDGGTEEERMEFVQVKSLQDDSLCLSDLKPKKLNHDLSEDDSFFGHLYAFWKKGFDVTGRVVVFGDIGPEMKGVTENLRAGASIRKKMVEQHGYPDDFCEWLGGRLSIDRADGSTLSTLLESALGQRVETAAAVLLAREYVMSYMYTCCRERTMITAEDWNAELGSFGLQASSVRGYLENYGHTIVPLSEYLAGEKSNVSALESAYRSGATAIPEHIALGLDIPRPAWQSKINNAFDSTNVVVVRAPSGQGKSTICYRWLMDRKAINHTYLLNGIVSEEVSGIVAALRGLAKRGETIYAYAEAGSDVGWVTLCAEVGRLSLPSLKLLVSVREDDAARAGYDASRTGGTDIILRFDKAEAAKLYERSDTTLFPSFESAWKVFGGDGPLMEFVYSLNHETTLRQKLEGQVANLRMTGSDDWLTFLYLASKAGEFGLPSSIADLKDASGCKDVQRMLAVLEREMLLRPDEERGLVMPLHPHRAKLLSVIIFPLLYQDEEVLVLGAAKCARGNYGPILVPFLALRSFSQRGLTSLVQIASSSWRCAAYAVRVMVWRDARRFYLSTADVRGKMVDKGLSPLLGSMLAGDVTEKSQPEYLPTLLKLVRDDAARESYYSLVSELADRQADFQETDRLLSKLAGALPPIDMVCDQASDAGFVLTYIGERGFSRLVSHGSIDSLARAEISESSGVDGILDLLVGYDSIGIDIDAGEREKILASVCRRDSIVWIDSTELITREILEKGGELYEELPDECLDSSGMVRQVSAVVAPVVWKDVDCDCPSNLNRLSSTNDVVMNAVCDLRRLFPDCGRYCVEYSGVKALAGGLEVLDCEKHIPEKNLRFNWMKLINEYYFGMCELDGNLAKDWRELEESVAETVSDTVRAIRECSLFIDAVLSGRKKIKGKHRRFVAYVTKAKEELDRINVSLPLCACDVYAFTSGQARAFVADQTSSNLDEDPSSPAFGMKKDGGSFLKTTRGFLCSLQNHFNNINDMMLFAFGQGDRPGRIAITNVAQACAEMDACNSEFSALFSGRQLLNDRQRGDMFLHAIYWNYLWCRKSTKREATLFRQSPRVKALREVPDRFVRRLGDETGVVSVSISTEGVVKVDYAASAERPFSVVATRCLQDVLKCDLESEEHLLEYWVLHHGIIEIIEVTYVSGNHDLIKKHFRFSSLMMHMDDPVEAERTAHAEITFDENKIDCLEEAVISFQSALGASGRLLECVLEVNEAIVAHDSGASNPANDNWHKWRKAVSAEFDRLLVRLDGITQLSPDDFEGGELLVDDLRCKARDIMNVEA